MPGAPLLHGLSTSSGPQGEGGAAIRSGAAAASLNVDMPTNVSFFVWLVVIGVVLPALVLGGLRVGGFQFVFRGR